MSDTVHATFREKGGSGQPIPVQFEPSSLQYTVQNQVVEQNGAQGQQAQGQRKQYVTQTNAKLTMDLVFDTTDTGANVVNLTLPIARLMQPQTTTTREEERTAPPVVIFEWGDYSFEGMIEQYRETIDFFHPSGVPLRSTLNVTLASQSLQFEQGGSRSANTSSASQMPAGQNPQSLATAGGNPRAARGIAQQNGVETLRFSRGPLTVSATVQLQGPAGFASGSGNIGGGLSAGFGGGIGGGVGFSAGASAGLGAGASGGFGVSASAGFGAGSQGGISFGGSSSAGVSATAGAFAGLGRSTSTSAGYNLNVNKLLPAAGSAAAFSRRRRRRRGPQCGCGARRGRIVQCGRPGIRFGRSLSAGRSVRGRQIEDHLQHGQQVRGAHAGHYRRGAWRGGFRPAGKPGRTGRTGRAATAST